MFLSRGLFLGILAMRAALATPIAAERPAAKIVQARNSLAKRWGRSDGSAELLAPRVFIVSLFTPEGAVWPGPLELGAINVTVPGFSPLFPSARCNICGEICQVITGEGEINAANTINALVTSDYFDLSKTYFYIGGIAGINPACGTLGSVAFSRYAVQVGLEYEIDAREIPANFSTGYVPLGAKVPDEYPVFLYGTEVFELNLKLRDRAIALATKGTLNDTEVAVAYRAQYPHAPANKPPAVFAGDVATSDAFWHGALLGESFGEYVTLLTNGSGKYCMTAQEDNASLEAFLRGALYGLVDFGRIILMRTAANFDRPPPGESAAQQLFVDNQGGFGIAVENIFQAGIHVVNDVIDNWYEVYYDGITADNYIGDILDSLKGSITPDIGSVNFQEG